MVREKNINLRRAKHLRIKTLILSINPGANASPLHQIILEHRFSNLKTRYFREGERGREGEGEKETYNLPLVYISASLSISISESMF